MANTGKLVADVLTGLLSAVAAEKAAVAALPPDVEPILKDIAIADALYPIASQLAKDIVGDLK